MSRANVAGAAAVAAAWRNLALRTVVRPRRPRARGANPFDLMARLRDDESRSPALPDLLLQRAVPAAILVFLVMLAAISYRAIGQEQERALADATASMELASSAVSGAIDRTLHADPAAVTTVLQGAVPMQALRRGLRIVVADDTGRIVAASPVRAAKSLAEEFGASEPLTIFAEKAGVMRLVMPSGKEALAAVRSLPTAGGQVAIVRPLDDVLAAWRDERGRTVVLIASIGAVLAALGFGYAWQANRARESETGCRSMRERVDLVLTRGRCGLWDWNLASGHIDWSLSMFEIMGMAPRRKALSFAEVNAMIHPQDGGLAELTRLVGANSGASIDHTFRMRGGDGEWVWLRAKAEVIDGNGGTPHLVGIAIDVTETMALEARSAAADMRLRDAIETISGAFVVWDAENRLVMCNSRFQRFHSLPADAVAAGTPYAQVMARGTTPFVQSEIQVGEHQPTGDRTFEAQLGDGRWLQIDERRTKDGGYVSVGTDVTTLKRHEAQLLANEEQLLNTVADLKRSRELLQSNAHELGVLAQKYREQKAEAETASRAKSDFLANMSHELRTPLNAILGFSEVMMTEAFGAIGSPMYLDYSKHIHQSGHYLATVITDVLEMAHLDSGRVRLERSDFAIADAIEAAMKSVAQAADAASITIQADPRAAIGLHADRNAVVKILAILLNNAVKYTPAGGIVSVRAQVLQGALNLFVEDTGVGIPPEALPRLGHAFEQADLRLNNGMRGSGLGLAIARSLAELHGGRMEIASKVDVGTTVLVQLPGETLLRAQPQLATANVRAISRSSRFAMPAKRAVSVAG